MTFSIWDKMICRATQNNFLHTESVWEYKCRMPVSSSHCSQDVYKVVSFHYLHASYILHPINPHLPYYSSSSQLVLKFFSLLFTISMSLYVTHKHWKEIKTCRCPYSQIIIYYLWKFDRSYEKHWAKHRGKNNHKKLKP